MDSLIIFGAKELYAVIIVAAIVYFFRQPKELRWKIALSAVIALPLTYLLAKLGSILYYNPRPFVVGDFTPLIPHSADNGFPSDHMLISSAIASVVFFFNRKLGSALLFIAFLVGVSRMLAGIHHLVDIIGSLAFAFLATWCVMRCILPKLGKLKK